MSTGESVTELLARWTEGDRDAFAALMPLVYSELKRLAAHYLRDERVGHTLQPTALVHEAYMRLGGLRHPQMNNRAQFLGIASAVMRRVLIDHARRHGAAKRGGHSEGLPADGLQIGIEPQIDLLELNDALGRLEASAPLPAKVVELRFFGGLSVEETAEYLGVSPATVKRHWTFARAWLLRALKGH